MSIDAMGSFYEHEQKQALFIFLLGDEQIYFNFMHQSNVYLYPTPGGDDSLQGSDKPSWRFWDEHFLTYFWH